MARISAKEMREIENREYRIILYGTVVSPPLDHIKMVSRYIRGTDKDALNLWRTDTRKFVKALIAYRDAQTDEDMVKSVAGYLSASKEEAREFMKTNRKDFFDILKEARENGFAGLENHGVVSTNIEKLTLGVFIGLFVINVASLALNIYRTRKGM